MPHQNPENLAPLDTSLKNDENSHATATFTNKQIKLQDITTNSLLLEPLSPNYRKMNISFSSILALIILCGIGLVVSDLFFEFPSQHLPLVYIASGIVCTLSAISVTYHYFADPLKMYAIRQHDMNYQSGLIFKSLVSQPILRIQHIELKQGPIERKYNLATLQVFSAGGASHTFNIPGLEYTRAVKLRQFILDHKDLAEDV